MTVIEQLVHQHDLGPAQIVLIGPKNFENGSLADVQQIAGVTLTDDIRSWRRSEAILVTTARSFKGLETDAAVLYDLDHISVGFSTIDLYVACTRARSHVHFCVTGKDMIAEINDAIATVQQEFDE